MALPKSVQRTVDAANNAHKDAYTPPVGDPAVVPAAATPAVDPAPAPGAPANSPPVVSVPPTSPSSTAAEVPPGSSVTPASVQDPFEQKFKVLQGKYNAEVPTLHRQLTDAQARAANLEALLATTRAAAAPSQAAVAAATPETADITQDELDQYGPEFIDLVGRAAKRAMAPILGDVGARVASLAEAQTKVVEARSVDTQQGVVRELSSLVPGWERLNTSQVFLDWLSQPDPYSGRSRQELLDQAFTAGDTHRVSRFFSGFMTENATVDPPASQSVGQDTPPVAPSARRLNPVRSLEALAAPGRGQASTQTPGAPNGQRLWTPVDVSRFYENKRRNRFTPEQAAALEADLFAAQLDGRLTQ